MKASPEAKRLIQSSYYKLRLSKSTSLKVSRVNNPSVVEGSTSANLYSPLKPNRHYQSRSTHKSCDCSIEAKIKNRMSTINDKKNNLCDKNFTTLQGFFPECKIYTLNKFDKLKHCIKRLK